jgi:hypothetical protein
MKLLNLYVFFTLFSQVHTSLMPTTKKICTDCKHFIGDKIECRKFGDTNLVTGKVTYHSASRVREDEKKCGEDAIQFEENHCKIITVPYYFLKENWIMLLPTSFFSLYIYLLINKYEK